MLSVPWFVVRTVQDLFRLAPVPLEHLQQQQQQSLQQRQPPTQHQVSQQQNEQPQQQNKQPQQVTQQQNKQSQQQNKQPHQVTQQQNKQLQQQGQTQQQTSTQKQKHPSQTQNEASKPTLAHAQNTSNAGKAPQAVNPDIIQAQTAAPLQHSSPATQQLEKTTKAPSTAKSAPEVDTSLKTSSKTLVLTTSASADRMSVDWAQKQIEKFKFDFDQADKDKSGTLSFQEVYDVLHNLGFKGSQEEAKLIFGQLDRDHDQKVTKEEFTAAVKNLPRLSIKEFVLRKIFLKLDKDASGYLSKSEIIDGTKSEHGLDISADKIADLLIYLSKEDDDGKVSYEEFLHVLGVEEAATVMHCVFTFLDIDGSGYLTKEEILNAVNKENELKLKADKIADLLIFWCRDDDKKISYKEFVDVWLKQKGEKPAK